MSESQGPHAEDIEIGGARWTLMTLPATKGIEILTWLGAILGNGGGAIGAAAQGVAAADKPELDGEESSEGEATEGAPNALDIDLSWRDLGTAIGAILKKLDDPRTASKLKTLLDGLRKDAKKVNFDIEFSGNYGVLFQLIAWALKVNFESFFDENPVARAIAQKAGPSLQRVRTSIGASGA